MQKIFQPLVWMSGDAFVQRRSAYFIGIVNVIYMKFLQLKIIATEFEES